MAVLLQFKKKMESLAGFVLCFGGDTSFIFPGAKGGRRIFHISTQIVLLTFDDVGMDACVIWKLKYSGV